MAPRLPRWEKYVFRADRIHTRILDDPRDPIQKYGQFAAPFFHVDISAPDGSVLYSGSGYRDERGTYKLQGLLIHSASYEFTVDGSNTLTITATNPDNQLQDTNIFRHHNNVDLWFGYDGHSPIYMGRGIMVEIEPNFSSGGEPTIRATCYDISYFMMEEGRAEIVPEGSTWWELRRAPPPPVCQPIGGTIVEDSIPDHMDEAEERVRGEIARQAREQGIDVQPAQQALTEALDSDTEMTGRAGIIRAARINEGSRSGARGGTHAIADERDSWSVEDEDWSQLASNPVDFLEHFDPESGQVSREVANPYDATTRDAQASASERMTWQRSRFPRRRRKAGHW